MIKRPVLFYAFLFVVAGSLAACAAMPRNITKASSFTVDIKGDTRVGNFFAPDEEKHPGDSGFRIVPSDMDAFVVRVALIEMADSTLDLQYFEVGDDLTVNIIMEKLLSAADRGVRVRLLFDDYGTGLTDSQLWLLDSHPNIEVRLFNPVKKRTRGFTHSMETFGNFSSYDHRMHNKAFIVDNAMGIVGGRNLGDVYFGARDDSNFADMDLVAAGPIVPEISKAFDIFWNCDWAIPLEYLTTEKPDSEGLKKALETLKERNKKAKDSRYAVRLRDSEYLDHLLKGVASHKWSFAKGVVLYDLPDKVSDEKVKNPYVYLLNQLIPLVKGTRSELILVAPYFVPGKQATEFLDQELAKGMKIKVFTNSLVSTDEVAVHAGYAKYRKALLEKGVELYELKARLSKDDKRRKKLIGTSNAGLHAKFYVFDRKAAFIGSRNLDNRSNRINTEIGILVQSPEIAETLAGIFDSSTINLDWFRLSLSKDSKLVWTTEENGKEVKYDKEPMTTCGQRSSAGFYSIFAPESEL